MKKIQIFLVLSLINFLLLSSGCTPRLIHDSRQKAKVARVWHGRTTDAKADEYEKYLYEEGVKKLESIPRNLAVQMFRRSQEDGITEFTVISYWESKDDIRSYAGDDIEKTRNLPRDPEYLLELEPNVKHFELKTNDWRQIGE